MHTIDPEFILGIARVSEFGARKYHMRNFLIRPGMPWSQVYGSLMRHLLKWWGGEELDVGPNGEYGPYPDNPEIDMKWSGLPHVYMVAWNVMVLCTYSTRNAYSLGDDRPSSIEYAGLDWKRWEAVFDLSRGHGNSSSGLDLVEDFLIRYSKETGSVVETETSPGKTVFTVHHR